MKNTYLFVPSYHRAGNLKTVNLFCRYGWNMDHIVVFVDDEAEDIPAYEEACKMYGCKLHVFSMDEARSRYDYVHRPSKSLRSAGQARNMMHDYARKNGIDFYVDRKSVV